MKVEKGKFDTALAKLLKAAPLPLAKPEPLMFTERQMERSVDAAYAQGFAAGERAERKRLEAKQAKGGAKKSKKRR